jgi:hypothetical protein
LPAQRGARYLSIRRLSAEIVSSLRREIGAAKCATDNAEKWKGESDGL